ncbi:glycoprotein hormone beta 5 isoform X2 [Arctopsyche grandis]|uniref:glycoprotein hormone beta 5 isoform X2 n=1 Tax=Arctopsyche grandis TaxID=121162 RepID=UPI00406D9643
MGYLQTKGLSTVATCVWVCWVLVVMSEAFELADGADTDWPEGLEGLEGEDSDAPQPEPEPERETTTLRCHRRLYKARVEQKDQEGRRCWDTLSLDACWGRCDSHEISEWKFPYKRSKHPVCGFGARIESVSRLLNCDEGAAPETRLYKHVRPLNCRCRVCSSSDTSCGWLPLH